MTCSDGAILRLYAAHNISFDFFNVSSILHAAKRAAAAASYIALAKHYLSRPIAYNKTISIWMNKPEFMIIDHCGVVRPDRPEIDFSDTLL